MNTPPRVIEALLGALGADRHFRDGVLGDLAEEFAARAEQDGVESARHWYRRETLRAVPHLLSNWSRRLGVRGVMQLVGVMVTAYVSVVLLALILAAIGYGLLRAVGAPTEYHLPWGNPVAATVMFSFALVLGVVATTLIGYIAARLDREAPLATAVACAFILGLLEIGVVTLAHQFPLWYRLALPLVIAASITAGGLIAVIPSSRPSKAAAG